MMTPHARFRGFELHWLHELEAVLALPAALALLSLAAALLCSFIHWS
jgi:hypothetical protein